MFRFLFLVLVSLLQIQAAKALTFTGPSPLLDRAQGVLGRVTASDNDLARCPTGGVLGWKVNGPGRITSPKFGSISVLTSTGIDEARTLVLVGSDNSFSGTGLALPIPEKGTYTVKFKCGPSFDRAPGVAKIKVRATVTAGEVILVHVKGSNEAIGPRSGGRPSGVSLPGIKIKPGRPSEGQTPDLFNLNPDGMSFNIKSTIEPSRDKKIFRATLNRSFQLMITNNGSQDFTFVVINRKTKQEVQVPIKLGETGTIHLNKGDIQLNILRVDKEEGVPADFDVKIVDSATGERIVDPAQFISQNFNLTGTFDSFENIEKIRFVLPTPIKLAIEKIKGSFDINIFRLKRGQKTEIIPTDNDGTMIYDFTQRGKHVIELTPREADGEYEVNIQVVP